MLNITNTGSIAQMIRDVRGIPTRVIPYAASTALTRTAQRAAKEDLPAEMRRVFDRPTPYTLNSLFVKPSTTQTLSARVMVKDRTSSNGTVAEDFILPSVEGGGRKEKRFERSLRYSGILAPGWRATLGQGAKLDGFGNMQRGEMQRILTAVGGSFDRAQNKTKSAKSLKNAKNAPYFAITPFTSTFRGGQHVTLAARMQPGIYRREGKRSIKPALIFTNKQPQYRPRLDFTGVVERVAEKYFRDEFSKAVDALMKRQSA